MSQRFPTLSLLTPRGRLVGGNLSTPNDKDMKGAKREKPQFFFALALPKADPAVTELLQQIMTHAWQTAVVDPVIQQRIQATPLGMPRTAISEPPFAWKIEDGDGANVARDGYAGCWVLKFSTTIPFGVYNAQNGQLDPTQVPLGSKCAVRFSAGLNGLNDKQSGLYLNPQAVRFEEAGPLIVTTPPPEAMFGAPLAMPPMPGAPGLPAAPGNPVAAPAAPAFAPAAPVPPTSAPSFPGTAFPSNPAVPQGAVPVAPVAPQGYPAGVQPHPGFLTPGSTPQS